MDTNHETKEWNLNGHLVTQLVFDYGFTIKVWWAESSDADNELFVVVEVPFVLQIGQSEYECLPGEPDSMAPALELLHKPAQSLVVNAAGKLEINFEPETHLIVERHAQFDSWQAIGQGELASIQLLCSAHDVPPWGS